MWTPTELENYLLEQEIQASILRNIGSTPTVADAARVLGVEVDQVLKSILFRVSLPDADIFAVAISHGEQKISTKALASFYGVGRKKVKLAPPDVVLEVLGYPVGGVPPLGHKKVCSVFIDSSIKTFVFTKMQAEKTILFAGGGDDSSMLKISYAELHDHLQPTFLQLSNKNS